MRSLSKRLSAVIAVIAFALTAIVPLTALAADPAPPTVTATVGTATVMPGQTTTLRFKLTNVEGGSTVTWAPDPAVTDGSISGDAGTGLETGVLTYEANSAAITASKTVQITYKATWTPTGGTQQNATGTAAITVAPPTVEAEAVPTTVMPGESSEITCTVTAPDGSEGTPTISGTWALDTESTAALTGKATFASSATGGTLTVNPTVADGTELKFKLKATFNPGGELVTDDIIVTVQQPTVEAEADPTTVMPGDTSEIECTVRAPEGASGTPANTGSWAFDTDSGTAMTGKATFAGSATGGTLTVNPSVADGTELKFKLKATFDPGGELVTDEITLTVEQPTASVDPSSISVFAGDTADISGTLTGPDGTAVPANDITWSATSGSTSVATVANNSGEGLTVTGVAAGETTLSSIKAQYKGHDYDVTGTVSVTVVPDTGSITVAIDPSSTSVAVDGTTSLTAAITPATPSDANYEWTIESGTDAVEFVGATNTSSVTVKGIGVSTTDAKIGLKVTSEKGDGAATASVKVTEPASTPSEDNPSASSSQTPGQSQAPTESQQTSSSAPSSAAPTLPGVPGASSAPSASASGAPDGEPSAQPSSGPSTSPSEGPTTEPSLPPASERPLEPAPDAPIDFTVEEDPTIGESVLTGLPIGSADEATDVSYLQEYTVVPEGATVEVLDAEGQPVEDNAPIATGQTVQVLDANGEVISSSVVVIKGDVMGTGRMSLTQVVRLADAYLGTNPLEGAYLLAGKFTSGDKITLTDLVKMAQLYQSVTHGAE